MHGSSYIIYSVIICLYFHTHSLSICFALKTISLPSGGQAHLPNFPKFSLFSPSQVTREFYIIAIYKVQWAVQLLVTLGFFAFQLHNCVNFNFSTQNKTAHNLRCSWFCQHLESSLDNFKTQTTEKMENLQRFPIITPQISIFTDTVYLVLSRRYYPL